MGSYRSAEGDMQLTWSMPAYSAIDHLKCRLGLHRASRKRVVFGWDLFTRVGRFYCACGSVLWIWFDDGFVKGGEPGEPGQHLAWIEWSEEMLSAT